MKKTIKHIHCPVNGWDCPYYTDHKHPCRCRLEDPMKNCDDFASMWDEDDDYIDDDWVEEEENKELKMEEILYANFDYYELKDIELSAEILVDTDFGKNTIEELLTNVKKVLEKKLLTNE